MRHRHGKLRIASGRTIAKLRRERDLSQEALASSTKVHRTYISLLERGLKSPTLDVVERLAAALDLSVHELLKQAEADRGRR